MRIKIGEMFAALVVMGAVAALSYFFVVESFRCGVTSVLLGRVVWDPPASGIDGCVNIHPIATVASLIIILTVLIFVIFILFEIGKKEIIMGEK